MVLLDKLLPKLKAEGHRVLIFSQFTKVLDLLEDFVDARGWGYERLDGAVVGVSRQHAIDRFSDPSSSSFIFLLSTRAGGIGINLTSADTVIMYDPDWNPQNDIQAMARCHRIGQTKPVQVYKLCTKDTYEMHMLSTANQKLGLEQAVMKSGGYGEKNMTQTGFAKAERVDLATSRERCETIERLLRSGAQLLAGAEHDARVAAFAEKSIDEILQENSQTRTILLGAPPGKGGQGGGMSNTFAQASFVSEGSGKMVDLEDPNFWAKMLPEVPGIGVDAEAA
jgi:superfamily II DNA or RNA helicase